MATRELEQDYGQSDRTGVVYTWLGTVGGADDNGRSVQACSGWDEPKAATLYGI